MKNELRNQFLLAALKALHQSERVLAFHNVGIARAEAWDFEAYIGAVVELCAKQRLDHGGVRHLRQIQSLFGQIGAGLGSERLQSGRESGVAYEEWLASAFPQAFAEMRREASRRALKHALN